MSDRRGVWQTLSNLLTRLERDVDTATNVAGLEQEVRKLGKTQFKANMLAEQQAEQWAEAIAATRELREHDAQRLEAEVNAARHELLTAIIPALDGLENAIASGQNYLRKRDSAAATPNLSPEQARLVSPTDRKMLAGWLEGLRLVRERLLAILETGGVTPIPTVGHPFDPYQHVAVGKTTAGDGAPGTIVARSGAVIARRRGCCATRRWW